MTTTFTAEIELDILKAVSEFSAVNDIRYYLNSVLFEFSSKGLNIVATDGHVIAVVHGNNQNTGDAEIIVPIEIVKKLPKKGRATFTATRTNDPQSGELAQYAFTFQFAGQFITGKSLYGIYPPYKQVFPKDISEHQSPSQFDMKYMALLNKVKPTLGQPFIRMFGESVAVVDFSRRPDVVALIMPMRRQVSGISELPDFVK